jgi:hypothetical protein
MPHKSRATIISAAMRRLRYTLGDGRCWRFRGSGGI